MAYRSPMPGNPARASYRTKRGSSGKLDPARRLQSRPRGAQAHSTLKSPASSLVGIRPKLDPEESSLRHKCKKLSLAIARPLQLRRPALFALALLLGSAALGLAQQPSPSPLPDAPAPQTQQPGSPQHQPETKAERQRRARQELRQEEKQRILGVLPNFSTVNNQSAAPLSAWQKFQLAVRSSVDPFVFVAAGFDAAISQANDDFPGYRQGAQGYAKRFGASWADTADGNLWGGAILPLLLREDPRYFRKGQGPFLRRALYSALTAVWAKRDSGNWGPNYANVGGNLIAGGISNLYYPSTDRGLELTFQRALTVIAEGAIGSEFVEFWPDISRRLFHKRSPVPVNRTTTPPEGSKPADQPPPRPR